MATIYIDPTVAGAGAGTLIDPYRSWSSVTWTAGNSYLQRAGTTFLGNVIVGASGTGEGARVTMGSYAAQSGDPTTDKSTIDGRTGFGARTITLSATTNFVTIQDLDLIGGYSGSNRRCIGATGNSLRLQRLLCRDVPTDGATDCDAIFVTGDNCEIYDCVVQDVADDGIWISSTIGPRILRTVVRRVAQSGRDAGDCIQLTGPSNGFFIEACVLDHSNALVKQAFIVSGASAGSGGTFVGNDCRLPLDPGGAGGNACIYSDQPGSVIRGNYTYGGSTGVLVDAAAGCLVQGNILERANRGIQTNGTVSALAVRHNVVMDCYDRGANIPTNDATSTLRNNIFLRNAVGCATHENVSHDYGCYFGNSTDWLSLSGGGSIDATALLVDPQLDAAYKPTNVALRTAGAYVGGLDYYGKECRSPPSVGAVQYQGAARSVVARAVVQRSIAARARTARRAVV